MTESVERPPGWRLAVDIGGTFTDLVLANAADGRIVTTKTLTTSDPLVAVREGVLAALRRAGADPASLREPIVHATTLVTNALIEDRAAPVALVTTAGFADALTIRTEHRYDIYDVQIELPPAPVPRERIFELPERTLADGTVARAPSEAEIDAVAERIRDSGAQTVAVAFLNSYAGDDTERRVGARLYERLGLPVSTSADVAQLIREYPRFVTVAANAATIPVLGPYMQRLQRWLAELDVPARVLIMLSNGGTVGTEVAARYPIRAIESGPAAGALAGSWFARRHASERLLCFDMGGTTAKACLLHGGEPQLGNMFEYHRRYRFVAGSGLPLCTPSVDLIEIGAGGGSIAHRDEFGLLAVGPHSAGAEPGPACYGRGGTEPTVTDADLLLGYLSPDGFAGGDLPLEVDAAERAMGRLGAELGMEAHELAAGVHELANQNMAAAAGTHAAERGADARGTPILAFGGAGPLHACGVAELLESSEVIFPPMASVLSAFGCLVTPVRVDLARSRLQLIDDATPERIEAICAEMRDEGRDLLVRSGIADRDVRFRYAIDARYLGQANELTVWLGEGARWPMSPAEAQNAFEDQYRRQYGMTIPDVPVEVVTWRVTALGPEPGLSTPSAEATATGAARSRRPMRFAVAAEPVEADVWARSALRPGDELRGPAVIEEPDTTIVLRPDWRGVVADDLSLVAWRGAGDLATAALARELAHVR
jgi:N-methylhydantoinase A